MFDEFPRPTCRSVYTVSDKRLRHGGSGYETILCLSRHTPNSRLIIHQTTTHVLNVFVQCALLTANVIIGHNKYAYRHFAVTSRERSKPCLLGDKLCVNSKIMMYTTNYFQPVPGLLTTCSDPNISGSF